jgi:tetratricopeptide (TPR) repeat protein
LPQSVPLSGLTICAVGNDVVVRKGGNRWQAESGQYLLELDVSVAGESLQIVAIDARTEKKEAPNAALEAQTWFDRGLTEEEERDPRKAIEAYERSRELDPRHVGARINLGRLHHDAGRLAQAERVYREALRECESDPTLFFNLGVLLEDTARHEEAIEVYQLAINMDPDFADAHFNLARLYEFLGRAQHAIRHLGEYRRLIKS